jgi:hypothetical protein
VIAQVREEIDPGHSVHHVVTEDHLNLLFRQDLKTFLTILGFDEMGEAKLAEHIAQNSSSRLNVIDY